MRNSVDEFQTLQPEVFYESIRYLGFALVFVLGCQGTPTVTRTGDVKDIIIGDNLSSGEIAVNTGDEVRWVNKRTAPVRIIFIDPVLDKQLSCKNNFGGWMTPGDTAQLATNETASLCFRDAGTFRYTVRMESAKTTGELNVPGVIKVGGQGGQAAWSNQVIKTVAEAVVRPVLDPVIKKVANRVINPVAEQAPRGPQLAPPVIEQASNPAIKQVVQQAPRRRHDYDDDDASSVSERGIDA